jgi:hypothetical protein
MSKGLTILAILVSSPAMAGREYQFPKLTENDTKTRIVLEKTLPDETIVRHPQFVVKIPKGWTLSPVGPSDKMYASLTATPTEDFENEETYFGINLLKEHSKTTLEEKKIKAEKSGKKARFVTWNSQRWLLREDSQKNGAGTMVRSWVAFGDANGIEVWVTAATPVSKLSQYEQPLFKIMESISLNKK